MFIAKHLRVLPMQYFPIIDKEGRFYTKINWFKSVTKTCYWLEWSENKLILKV